jgi:hypothetical protein
MSASRGRLRTRALPDRVPRAVGGHVAGPVPDADASGVAPGRPSSRDRPAGRQAPERGGADPSERGPRCRPNLSGRFLCRQDFVAHSWPKRRSDDWLNHAEPVRRRVEKYLQIGPFRGVRRRTSSRPTRPVTPEVAGSSPVAPVHDCSAFRLTQGHHRLPKRSVASLVQQVISGLLVGGSPARAVTRR